MAHLGDGGTRLNPRGPFPNGGTSLSSWDQPQVAAFLGTLFLGVLTGAGWGSLYSFGDPFGIGQILATYATDVVYSVRI